MEEGLHPIEDILHNTYIKTSTALSKFSAVHKSWDINITFMGSITSENASILDLEYLASASLPSVPAEAFPHEA